MCRWCLGSLASYRAGGRWLAHLISLDDLLDVYMTVENERMAKVEQALQDHLVSCNASYGRNCMEHKAMMKIMEKISNRLWALILSMFVLSLGVAFKFVIPVL